MRGVLPPLQNRLLGVTRRAGRTWRVPPSRYKVPGAQGLNSRQCNGLHGAPRDMSSHCPYVPSQCVTVPFIAFAQLVFRRRESDASYAWTSCENTDNVTLMMATWRAETYRDNCKYFFRIFMFSYNGHNGMLTIVTIIVLVLLIL